jgi:eukaryotic-like serine/threonine-protein kinase
MGAGRFGKYTLIARLAKGGMAEIFFARLEGVAGFEKPLVIKRLLPDLAEDQEFVGMFLDEARLVARISHPNVCQVYELGEFEGQYFIAMEYLEGAAVDQLIGRMVYDSGAVDLRLVTGIFAQACEGLHDAHELADASGDNINLVHRDVSPQNLFVTVDGVVKVIDFGIAKARDRSIHTRTGTLKGKYVYMSPEQLNNRPIDRRVDVFALGAVLFEMLTGQQAFARATEFLMFKAINQEERPRVSDLRGDMPPEIDAAITKALALEPDDRFPTARAFGEAVAAGVAHLGGPLGMAAIGTELRRLCGDQIEARRALITRRAAIIDSGRGPLAASLESQPPSELSSVSVVQRTVRSRGGRRARLVALGGVGIVALAALLVGGSRLLGLWGAPATAGVAGLGRSPLADAGIVAPTPGPAVSPTSLPVPANAATPAPPASAPPASAPLALAPPPAPPTGAPRPAPPTGAPRPAPPTVASTQVGYFTIDSKPYATIFVDGKKIGETPLFRVRLAPGRRRVMAVLASGKSQTFAVVITPGKQAPPRRLEW